MCTKQPLRKKNKWLPCFLPDQYDMRNIFEDLTYIICTVTNHVHVGEVLLNLSQLETRIDRGGHVL